MTVAEPVVSRDISPNDMHPDSQSYLLLTVALPIIGIALLVLHDVDDPFMQYSAAGAALLMSQAGLRRVHWLLITAVGLMIAPHLPGNGWFSPYAAGVGLASLIVGGPALHWADRRRANAAVWAGIFPIGIAVAIVCRQSAAPRLVSYDLYAAMWDNKLFGPVAFKVGEWFKEHPVIASLHEEVYNGLPFGMAVGLTLTSMARRWRVVAIFVLSGCIGLILYPMLPIGGPLAAFPNFPTMGKMLPLRPTVLAPESELTGFPSLHFAWSLLVAASIWRAGTLARVLGILFIVTTAVATLGLGMHWAVDLIAAVPYAGLLWLLVDQSFKLFSRLAR